MADTIKQNMSSKNQEINNISEVIVPEFKVKDDKPKK